MRMKDVLRLVVTVFVSASLLTGCSKPGSEKKADEERRQLETERKKVAKTQAEIDKKKTEIEALEKDLKEKMAALTSEREAWNNDRKTREMQIEEMTSVLKTKKEEVGRAEADLAAMKETSAAELAKIAAAQKSLDEQKKATEAEIASLRAEAASQVDRDKSAIQTKIAELEAQSKNLQEQQQAIEIRDADSKKRQEAIASAERALAALKAQTEGAAARLQSAVQEARELFKRDGMGDVFDKLNANAKMKFLVSIVGRGSLTYVQDLRAELAKIDAAWTTHAVVTRAGKNESSFVVDDQMIVSGTAEAVRKFRDDANAFMERENKRGVAASATSLFVVARPIQKVRAGLKLTVIGSKSAGFDKRRSDKILELNQIRATDARVYDIEELDLGNPGSFVFASDRDGRKCTTLDLECLKVLKDSGFLESQHVIHVKSSDGNSTTTLSNREALVEVLNASITQMNIDHDLYDKGLPLFAINYSMEDGFNSTIDTESLKKLGSIFLGLGETRLPIVDKMELGFRIAMIDEVSNTGNHIDTWKFMSSGLIQNIQMFPVNRARNEIEIQLPIGSLKTASANMSDLGLADYVIKAVKPVEPTEAQKKLEESALSADMGTADSAAQAAVGQYRAAMRRYKEQVRKEKTAEYKRRLKINMGKQQIFIDAIK